MPTSYTSLLGLALPVTGELSGTWGDTVNSYITQYVDAAVEGTQTISGSQTAVTLSTANGTALSQAGSGATGSAQYAVINCTGNPASLLTITVPNSSRNYIVINATSTSQSVKVVGTGPTTGVTLASGEKAVIAWNGSDFIKIASTVALPAGSTTQVQYNNAGALAGSANFVFDGTNVGIGTSSPTRKLTISGSGVFSASAGASIRLDNSNTSRFAIVDCDNSQNLNIWNSDGGTGSTVILRGSGAGTETARFDGSGNLGIGTSSPGARLNAVVSYVASTIVPSLKLSTVGGYNTNSGTAIDFGQDQGTYSTWVTGRIASPRTGNNWGGSLTFSTNDDSGQTALVERMRITSAGFTQPVAYADTVSALGNTGTATTINLQAANVFTATLTGNCTFTLSNPIATGSSSFTLILTNDGTAGRTVAWSGGSFVFPGGAASLSRTTTANAVDVWVFFTPNGGTTWYGNIAMKNMTA